MEILIILLTLLLGGCAAPNGANDITNGTEKVIFTLPGWPPEENGFLGVDLQSKYPALNHWEITITRSDEVSAPNAMPEKQTAFSVRNTATSNKTALSAQNTVTSNKTALSVRNTVSIAPKKKSFTLTLPQNEIVAITARPVTKNSNGEKTLFFYPAGTVYPNLSHWDGNVSENTLTWEDGFTAKVIELIYGAAGNSGYSKDEITDFVSHFNWKKFSGNIHEKEEKSQDIFYNPWQIDLSTMIPKLLSKNFTATAMTSKKIIPLTIEDVTLPQNKTVIKEIKSPQNTASTDQMQFFQTPPLLSPYIPENRFIALSNSLSVSTITTNRFLYNADYVLRINAPSEKKVSTEVVFLPKIVEVW